MDWKKGRRCLTEIKATTEDWGSKGIRLSATESKATNKRSALSRCIRPTSHKGMILFLLVTDLASVRQGMLQGKRAMKAGAKNPAAPAPGSKKEQGTAYPDMAQIQDYVLAVMQEFLVQSLKGL